MDLFAYVQIDDLGKVAKDNGIEVPRLRGYRLMSEEEPVPQSDIEDAIQSGIMYEVESMIRALPYSSCVHSYSWRTDRLLDRYLIKGEDDYDYVGIRWDRIHGKLRKDLKFALKKVRRKYQKQYDIFNKYCGQPGILYIHARIGGGNWNYYGGPELAKKPWFIEKVDDSFDSTYCDIYARIGV